jgi:NAD(P)-dependent dehydrogenase (short-subunit alcohol dehydrogenase family)
LPRHCAVGSACRQWVEREWHLPSAKAVVRTNGGGSDRLAHLKVIWPSLAWTRPSVACFAVYAATKHAVRALSEGLRQGVTPYNVRTTVISPGAVATELPNSITDPVAAERVRKI